MTGPAPAAGAPPGDPGEESRYQAAQALDPVVPARLEELLRFLADPSWRVRAAASERITAHPRPESVLPSLLEVATAGSSPGARNAAAGALARLGAAAVAALVARLASARAEERCTASDVLGEIGDRRAALALSDLLSDPDANVRVSVAEALGKVGGSYAIAALEGALEARDASLRVAALDALGRLGIAPPIERLQRLLEDRGSRVSAYRMLALTEESGAVALLARGISEMSRGAREAAYVAVARQAGRHPEALAPLAGAVREAAAQSPSVVTWAVDAVSDSDLLVAEGAVRVLGWAGHLPSALRLAAAAEEEALRPAVIAALVELGPGIAAALGDAPSYLSPQARVAVLTALVRAGNRSAVPELAAVCEAGDMSLRAKAIEALGASRDEAAVAPLARLLDHPEPEVSGLAAAALEELSGAEAALREAVLLWCRPPAEGRTPAALLRLLGQIGGEGDLPLMRRTLRDPRPATRVAAAQAVGALALRGLARGFPCDLLPVLDDPEPRVRAAAAVALGAMGLARALDAEEGNRVAEALGAALRDEIPAVRAAAARAAGACGADRLAGPLAALVAEEESEVAAGALHALTQMGRAQLPLLERAAAHPDAEVVKEAMAAAARFPLPDAGELLLGGLCHPRWDVRRAAARAVAERGDRGLCEAVRDVSGVEEDPLVLEALSEALRALGG